jgi:hypothetical protein
MIPKAGHNYLLKLLYMLLSDNDYEALNAVSLISRILNVHRLN